MSVQLGKNFVFAWRTLWKTPLATGIAVLSLAIAMAPNTTLFSIVDQLLLTGSLSSAPDSLVGIRVMCNGQSDLLSFAEYRALLERDQFFSAVVASQRLGAVLRLDGARDILPAEAVSANYFRALNVKAVAGRPLNPVQDGVAAEAVPIVISYNLWQRRFSGSREAIGRSLVLNNRQVVIVGVADRGFRGVAMFGFTDLWVPLEAWRTTAPAPAALTRSPVREFTVFGMLRPGINAEEVSRQIESLPTALGEIPLAAGPQKMVCWPARADEARARLFVTTVVLSMGLLVLLVASANVCTLLMMRAAGRRREIAIRTAIGASTSRITLMLFAEGLLLSLMAAATGLTLSWLLLRLAPGLLPQALVSMDWKFQLDLSSLLYTLAIAVTAALFFTVGPARHSTKVSLVDLLNTKVVGFRGRGRLSSLTLLICAQVFVSQALLCGAAILLRGYRTLEFIRPGFDQDKPILLAHVMPDSASTGDGSPIRFEALRDRLGAIPGVRQVSYARVLPLSLYGGGDTQHVLLPDGAGGTATEAVEMAPVGPAYFQVLGVRLLCGREFSAIDLKDRNTAIVNLTLARRAFPKAPSPAEIVGLALRTQKGTFRIVGVAEDGKYSDLHDGPRPYMYTPISESRGDMILMIEAATSRPELLSDSVRRVVSDSERRVWITSFLTLREYMRLARHSERLLASILTTAGLVSVLLAAIGLAGLSGYWIANRTHETAVRLALGATRGNVVWHTERHVLRPVLVGMVLGSVGGGVLCLGLSRVVPGIPAFDGVSICGSALWILGASIVATITQAIKGAAVNVASAVRRE